MPLAIVATVCACSTSEVADPAPVTVVRLAVGAPGGSFDPFGSQLVEKLNAGMVGSTVQHQAGGGVANLGAIQRGDTDLALTYADVAYLAYTGRLEPYAERFDQLRAIAVLYLTPLQLVARAGSGIRKVADLRGRRVAIGTERSGTALSARLIMDAFGLESSVRTEFVQFRMAGRLLVAGQLDAMFDRAFFAESAAEALAAGGTLVSIDGPLTTQLAREYPFLRQTVIPRHTYIGVEAVQTIGVETLLICRRSLDAETVHRVTEALFAALPQLSSTRRRFVELDEAPAAPIPLHEGAARYYRERELLR